MSKNSKTTKDKKTKKDNLPHKEKMNLYVVDTIATFRHRYVIEAKSLEHAYDEVTMKDSGNEDDAFEEVTQKFIGESIIDGREITKKEFNLMLESLEHDEGEWCSHWMGDKLIRKINYDRNDMQVRVKDSAEFGKCGCGRSPTGKCIGWHGLTDEDYKLKLQEYKDSQSVPKDSEQGG